MVRDIRAIVADDGGDLTRTRHHRASGDAHCKGCLLVIQNDVRCTGQQR